MYVRRTICKKNLPKKEMIRLMTQEVLKKCAELAHVLANIAQKETLGRYRSVDARNKGGSIFDPVTEADEEAEKAMRARIMEVFPNHAIIGEEYDDINAGAEFTWVLDPIDGTRGFITGMPTWGTLIGLLHEGKPVFGLMSQPYVGERFFGDGKTAYWQKDGAPAKPIRARGGMTLSEAYLACTTPDMFSIDELSRFMQLHGGVRDARYGTDCYGYALLALGTVQLVCEAGLKAVDILPLMPILQGAGVIVTDWEGAPVKGGGQVIAAADEALHAKALALIQKTA